MSQSIEIDADQPRYLDAAARMDLIHLSDAAGVVYWKPAGLRLYEQLRAYIRKVHQAHDYQEVKSPALVGLSLFEKSGHLGRYRENMFLVNQANEQGPLNDLQGYAMRPMSCPNHIEIYRSSRRSYRELPLALFEFGEVFRNEPSGSLQVLFRQRQFCQDDSHVFVARNQISQGVANYLHMALQVYRDLGFNDVQISLSLRPEQRYGDDALWDQAEDELRQACRENGVDFVEVPGGGAFYGPKLELGVRDKLGRVWQMGVIQLDYVLPERFELQYIAESGKGESPVILHHAVLGSLERMIGTLLEAHGVELPGELHPYPLAIVPVSNERHGAWARELVRLLRASGKYAHVDLDQGDQPVNAKVRQWRIRGARKVVLVGDRESAGPAADFAAQLLAEAV